MKGASGLLSVIIVNYHSGALVCNCLQTLLQHNTGLHLQLLVVDNSNNADDRALVCSRFPQVTWMAMNGNEGFARANNRGMRAATGDAFLLLNPDTLCVDDSVYQCYRRLMESPHAGAGVQLLNNDLEPQISGSYFVWGGLNHVLPIPYWGAWLRWVAYRAGSKMPGVQQPQAVQEVDWISGAFLMVKRSAVQGALFMDEDFFLYGEEVEWCSRLRRVGTLALYGDLKIVHLEGATINQSQNLQEQGYYNLYDKKGLQLMVSNHLRVRKQYGIPAFVLLLLQYTWGVVFYFVCTTVHRLFTARHPAGSWKQAGQFAHNVWRLWRLAPQIVRNRPYFYKMF